MARLTNLSERGIETQRMLSDVLMQLLGETNYNKISVKDITVRAGIDRSTFYLHFKDKDDLFLAAQKRLVEELLEGICFKCPWIGLERKICMDYIPEQGSIRG